MSDSNQQLIIKLRSITDRLPKIVDQAGEALVRNIRSNVRARLKTSHRYPFEFQNDFQKPATVTYNAGEKAVIVDHVAAKRLEYGLPGTLTIEPGASGWLCFDGQDGERVCLHNQAVVIKNPGEALGYAQAAIKETEKDLAKMFKEVIGD